MQAPALRLGEFVATLALAQDNAFGQPLESQLRSCLLATWLCEAAGHDSALRDTVYWTALLRYLGCTGHAHEVATVFGDEIAIRAQTLVHDAANPAEVMRDVIAFATARHPPEAREQVIEALHAGVHEWIVRNFNSGCEVADMLAGRLGMGQAVRAALACTFERWNGQGFPKGVAGTDIPLAMRIVHLTHDMEAIARLFSPQEAIEAARDRRDRTYDPALADLFVQHGPNWLERLARLEPWDAVLENEPSPRRTLHGPTLDDAMALAADFIDLKSPYMAGHSRRCAQLCEDAAARLGLDAATTTALRHAALLHDFGSTGVPNSIWDKPGPLTRAEADRVELHTLLTEQMLRRSPALAPLGPIACAHHERTDGSGYHKRVPSGLGGPAACVLAAADAYVGLTTERADRPAWSADDAARELRRQASAGQLEPVATEAVLSAAGHPEQRPSRVPRAGGLTRREVQVLHLAAKGLTTQQIGDRLFISAKTADHHIQNLYGKIGVSTRAAAALWAMQNAVIEAA
jgi:HD-GYP domain-containing protein (c-di-GMP phosphodiesterase class II)